MKPSIEEFRVTAKEVGIENVTEEEYTDHTSEKWSVPTALRRIGNARKKEEEDENKEIVGWKGIPLGGRDFIYKKKGTDKFIKITESRSQRIALLMDDGTIRELSNWGDFKGRHGQECELEIEVTERETPTGVFIDNTVRTCTILDKKITLQRLLKVARDPDELTERDKYQYVVLKGVIGKFDTEATWEDGVKSGSYPINYNKAPCLNFILKGTKGEKHVRCQLAPTRYGMPYIEMADFDAMKDTAIEEYGIAFEGAPAVVAGWVRKVDPQAEVTYINLMTTAVFSGEEPKPKEPTQGTIDTTPREATQAPANQPQAVTDAKAKHEQLMKAVIEAHTVLGEDLTVDSFKEIHGDFGLGDKLLKMAIERHLKES